MGEVVERMLCPVMELLEHPSPAKIEEIVGSTDMSIAPTATISSISQQSIAACLDERQSRRGVELIDIAINLEHAGTSCPRPWSNRSRQAENGNKFSDEGLDRSSRCFTQRARQHASRFNLPGVG